ncbi:hypothetical protein H1R20_g12458, partial [Candolleomyces eurysporus]
MANILNPYADWPSQTSVFGVLPPVSRSHTSNPPVFTFNYVTLSPDVLNCTITGPDAVPYLHVTTVDGGYRTVFSKSNSGGLARIDWAGHASVDIPNCMGKQFIGQWLVPAGGGRRIMTVRGSRFMWASGDNCIYLDRDGAPPSNHPLARIYHVREAITLELTIEAVQLGLLEAAIVATVVFRSNRNFD